MSRSFLQAETLTTNAKVVYVNNSTIREAKSQEKSKDLPTKDKQYSIPSDTEYLKLAENPEKNKAILSEMVKQKAYDSGLKYVGNT